MSRPDTVQWNCKQWLGDNKVLAMDWDARAMHFHLLMISTQETPPGTIPADDAAIRRWLSLPSGSVDADQTWRRVKSQILAAWQSEGDRFGSSGMIATFERKEKYSVRPQNQIGTTSVPKPIPKGVQIQETDTYVEKNLDVGFVSKEPPIDFNMAGRRVFEDCGLAGNEALMLTTDATRAYARIKQSGEEEAALGLVALWLRYESDISGPFKCRVFKFFKSGMWQYPEKWKEMAEGSNSKPDKAAEFIKRHGGL